MKYASDLHYLAIYYISFNDGISMKDLTRLLKCDMRATRQIIYDIRKAYVKTENNEILPYVYSDKKGYHIATSKERNKRKEEIKHAIIELARELKVINYIETGKNQIQFLEVRK